MTSRKTQLICNKFAGIRTKNATFSESVISASDLQNVELYHTGMNKGIGIRTTKGNVSICDTLAGSERIVNTFKSIQQNNTYFFVHTESETQGKIYLYNLNKNTLTLKKSGLTVTGVSNGVDFAQGWSDLFVFSNGVEFLTIEIGAKNEDDEPAEVKIINDVDTEGRTVKGLGLVVYNGRIWIFDGNILRYCVQNNIYDWHTSDATVSTSAGFIEYTKIITAIYMYLDSVAIFFKDSSVQLKGTYPYQQGEESPGGCAGVHARVFHGTELYFYDDTKKGIFSFSQIVLGDKTLGKNIAEEIQNELMNIDSSRLNEVRAISVILSDRNELWWILPTTDPDYSTIMIYDYLKGEWIKRKSQKINCAMVFEGKLYSGSEGGKILNEYNSNTFDGQYIQHYYNCSPMNLGANNTLKVLHLPPRVSYDLPYINTFKVKYIKNFDTFKKPKIKLIKAKFKNFLIWGEGYWGVNYWASKATNTIGKFPTATFKIIQIHLYTENAQQNFAIKNIEFSKIKIKQV
jgi:hypothetical protein